MKSVHNFSSVGWYETSLEDGCDAGVLDGCDVLNGSDPGVLDGCTSFIGAAST